MKYWFIIISGMLFLGGVIIGGTLAARSHTCPLLSATELQEPTFDDLRDAIEWVESRGDRYAIGPNGERGILQLSEIYIDDVNRIIGPSFSSGEPIYEYIDAFSPKYSRIMFGRYITYYLDVAANHDPNMSTFELIARIHNGGPNAWRNDPEWFVRNRGYTLEDAKKKIENAKDFWNKVKGRLTAGSGKKDLSEGHGCPEPATEK